VLPEMILSEMLDAAMKADFGLRVESSDPAILRSDLIRFRQAQRRQGNDAYDPLSFRTLSGDHTNLFIIRSDRHAKLLEETNARAK
jgi:hypothetical protein